jgi:hypothetical protein
VFEGGHMGSWTITERGIFVMTPYLKAPMQIDFFSFESSRIIPVLQLPPEVRLAPASPTLAVSRDGKWMLLVQYDQWGSDIQMLEGSW